MRHDLSEHQGTAPGGPGQRLGEGTPAPRKRRRAVAARARHGGRERRRGGRPRIADGAGAAGPGRWRRRARSPARRATSARTARRRPTSPTRTSSPSIRSSTTTAAEHRHPAPLDRRALGRGPGLERQGRYLVWSDIPNNRQMRWLEDDGQVTVFRMPSNNSNGNTLRLPGPADLLRAPDPARGPLRARRLDHGHRRLLQRQAAQLAQRRRPPSGRQLWFTDPPYGGQLYEGDARRRRRPEQRGRARSTTGSASRPGSATFKRELPTNCYRVGPERPARPRRHRRPGAGPERPLLLARLQEAVRRQHRQGAGRHGPGGKGDVYVFDVGGRQQAVEPEAVQRLHGRRRQVRPGRRLRCDVDGNLWVSSNAGRAVGYSGVTVWTPDGKLIGRIRLPEVCGNITFGGPKRNRLFMAGEPVALRGLHRHPGRCARADDTARVRT